MKKWMMLVVIILIIILSGTILSGVVNWMCPVDYRTVGAVKEVAKKGAVDFLKDPQKSSLSPEEVKDISEFAIDTNSTGTSDGNNIICNMMGRNSREDIIRIMQKIDSSIQRESTDGTCAGCLNSDGNCTPKDTCSGILKCQENGLFVKDCTCCPDCCPVGTVCDTSTFQCEKSQDYGCVINSETLQKIYPGKCYGKQLCTQNNVLEESCSCAANVERNISNSDTSICQSQELGGDINFSCTADTHTIPSGKCYGKKLCVRGYLFSGTIATCACNQEVLQTYTPSFTVCMS